MDNTTTEETTEPSFAVELAKVVVVSAAVAGATIVGMYAGTVAIKKLEARREKKAAKKEAKKAKKENKEN